MEKKIVTVFGRKNYLLGEDAEGIRHYIEEPKFDCGWYWGGLYIETFTNNRQPTRSVDISSHSHFDSMFLKCDGAFGPEVFKKIFKKTVFNSDKEMWRLLELARTFYTLRKAADLFHIGGSHITTNDCYDVIKDQKMYEEIVKVKLPAVISEIMNLLGGDTKPEEFTQKVVLE